jgi:hypothetical protein
LPQSYSADRAPPAATTRRCCCARRCHDPEFAVAGDGGHAAPHELRNADGRAVEPGPGVAGIDDCQRTGTGIDAISHKGATDVGRRAIGVLGTGIDVCYSKENKKWYEKVLERGAIISAFPVGWHPAPQNFPVRNRIIGEMAIGEVIVEGKQYSQSLHLACRGMRRRM